MHRRNDHYLCGKECFSVRERCDGVKDCRDGQDEKNCGSCINGSRRCGQRLICHGDFCADDDRGDDNNDDEDLGEKELIALSEFECSQRCDRFWCRSERQCIGRKDRLQGELIRKRLNEVGCRGYERTFFFLLVIS